MKTLYSFVFAAAFIMMLLPLGSKAQSCDTLFNLVSSADTPTYYLTNAGGYLSGNNGYGDEMKAEGFTCTPGYYLNSATVDFGYVAINPSDSGLPVTIYVLDNTGSDLFGNSGAPGNIIDSAQVSMGQIAQAVSATNNGNTIVGLMVNFPNAPALQTNGVYVAVNLPQLNGDTVALYTNTFYGPDGNGWEYDGPLYGPGWASYDEDWSINTGALGNYIWADICPAPLSIIPAAQFSASATSGCSPLTVNFTDLTSLIPALSWSWYFSDGTSSSVQNPSHTFTVPGMNIVTESVSLDLGTVIVAYVSANDTINISPNPIVINNITPAANAGSATGSAIVITSGGVTPYSYSWANNNSNTSDSISNVIPGNYVVSVTGGNSCVAVDTVNINYAGSLSAGCSAAFNLAAPQNSPTYYILYDGSYLSGNTSNNLAIAEGFPAAPGAYINSAAYYFGYVAINATDSDMPVTLGVWDNTGISIDTVANAPGNMIDSTTVTLREIAQAVTDYYNTGQITGVLANFHDVTPLTFGNIYAGVILPTTFGDTVALLTNAFNGYNGNGWEYEVNYVSGQGYGWNPYDSDYNADISLPYAMGNYIVANICGTADTVTPNASFTVSDTAACSPDTVQFTDMSSPAPTNWYWVFGDGSSSGAMNPTYVYGAGQYTAMELPYDSTNTTPGPVLQFYNAATVNVNSYSAPVPYAPQITPASSDTSANGGAIVVAAQGTYPYSYVWNTGSDSNSIVNVLPAVYTVTITDAHNCKFVDSVTVTYTTGILQLSAKTQVKIYPNPTANWLNLVWSQPVNAEVSIIDMDGHIISNYESNGAANNIYDVHNLSSGTYVIRITDKANNQQQSMLFTKL